MPPPPLNSRPSLAPALSAARHPKKTYPRVLEPFKKPSGHTNRGGRAPTLPGRGDHPSPARAGNATSPTPGSTLLSKVSPVIIPDAFAFHPDSSAPSSFLHFFCTRPQLEPSLPQLYQTPLFPPCAIHRARRCESQVHTRPVLLASDRAALSAAYSTPETLRQYYYVYVTLPLPTGGREHARDAAQGAAPPEESALAVSLQLLCTRMRGGVCGHA
ncbi:hypothetical protein C8Q79DRAFT_370774 [Trametes meyenii]|nr:hypothetical protein C8Q79DRAFT_370774 [Trametes meyenii]